MPTFTCEKKNIYKQILFVLFIILLTANDCLCDFQLEGNIEFQEFLEVHKTRSNKSAWSNDIVLSSADAAINEKGEKVESNVTSEKEVAKEAVSSAENNKSLVPKQKLSDLDVSTLLANLYLSNFLISFADAAVSFHCD
jgi:hypothetical protein